MKQDHFLPFSWGFGFVSYHNYPRKLAQPLCWWCNPLKDIKQNQLLLHPLKFSAMTFPTAETILAYIGACAEEFFHCMEKWHFLVNPALIPGYKMITVANCICPKQISPWCDLFAAHFIKCEKTWHIPRRNLHHDKLITQNILSSLSCDILIALAVWFVVNCLPSILIWLARSVFTSEMAVAGNPDIGLHPTLFQFNVQRPYFALLIKLDYHPLIETMPE